MLRAQETSPIQFNPVDGCTVVAIQAYAPPAEMAAAVALWAWSVLVVGIAAYLLTKALLSWLRGWNGWHSGFEAGCKWEASRKERQAQVVPLYPAGAGGLEQEKKL